MFYKHHSSYIKILIPGGCLPLPHGYIHVYDYYFQTPSPKPLGHLKPSYMWSILGARTQKFVLGFMGHITKMAAMP